MVQMTALYADLPSSDPKDDLFGHAPFAKSLAESIYSYQSTDGLVLALYGPWGSGKSTVLNYVGYYLDQIREENRPVVVTFNPWWFSGQENLARAFLGQLQVVLPSKNEHFKKLAEPLGHFAEGIGGLIDISGMTGGVPIAGKFGKFIQMVAKRKPKDVPALKSEISRILKEAGKRILIVVDDIDRLTPDETRQLFTVIKALADFPNVIYLLAFDRKVAAKAIKQQSGLPGKQYLEKIIQVPFELPPVDRFALRSALIERLNQILEGTPDGLFVQSYWTNVYYDGIDPLIQVPRDMVRFTNTLSVTYPAVRGEVNPVDFIALEAIRIFLPGLYDIIRTNPERFSGKSGEQGFEIERNEVEQFRQHWEKKIPKPLRVAMQALLELIFPRTGMIVHSSDDLAEWRKNLRVCHPDLFPIYFRFSIPFGAIRRSDMTALLNLAGTPAEFSDALVQAKEEKCPDGSSKARALLQRLMDHVEKNIPDAHICSVIQSLLDIGDVLIDPAEDRERGMFDFGIVSHTSRPAYHLLKRAEADNRACILELAIRSGNAVAVQSRLLKDLDEEIKEANVSGEAALLVTDEVEQLKLVWLDRVRMLSAEAGFPKHPELPRLLSAWSQWSNEAEVRTWCDRTLSSDKNLLRFLTVFLQYEHIHYMGDRAIRRQPRLDPTLLERYLNTAACADRLRELQRKDEVPADAQVAVSQYLKEFDMALDGENPNDTH